MEEYQIYGEYIQLNQLLKTLGWVETGSMANDVITEGYVKVNGEVEYRKRNKIKPGMIVSFDSNEVKVIETRH